MIAILNKYAWKTRFRGLWVFTVLFALFCYQVAIKKTLEARARYQMQDADLALIGALEIRVKKLQQQSRMGQAERTLPESYAEKEHIVRMAETHKVRLKRFAQEASAQTKGQEIIYTGYYFSASFLALLKLLNSMEKEPDMHLMQVHFYLESNREKEQELIMKLTTTMVR